MILFPNCKINLGLQILRKRDDGFHDLDTIFYPLPLQDALECLPSNKLKFEQSGIEIPSNGNENIVLKAYHLLKKDFPNLPNLNMHLLKNIPTGAGLGGGSADASFMLMMLNKEFQLQITKQKILDYALELGSDCPFFIYNIPCHALSQGEQITPINLNLSEFYFLIVKPSIHISTAIAFSKVEPNETRKSTLEIIQQPIETWKNELINDFEFFVSDAYPELMIIKQKLYQQGAIYASMSGSGSAFYGIFKNKNLEINNAFEAEELFWI